MAGYVSDIQPMRLYPPGTLPSAKGVDRNRNVRSRDVVRSPLWVPSATLSSGKVFAREPAEWPGFLPATVAASDALVLHKPTMTNARAVPECIKQNNWLVQMANHGSIGDSMAYRFLGLSEGAYGADGDLYRCRYRPID
jgi:hypothetical protein